MLSFYSFYCPYCKHLLATTQQPNSYGNPLKLCPKCNKTYIDAYCTERAFFEYRPYSAKQRAIGAAVLSWGFSFFVTAITGFVSQSDTICWITLGVSFPLFWLFLFFSGTRNRVKSNQKKLELWYESDQRLRNLEYAAILKAFGYNVPTRYLSSEFMFDSSSLPYQAIWVQKPSASQATPCTRPDASALSGRI